MNIFNAISVDLMQDFSLNTVQLGYLSGTYLAADMLFLLPGGIILDRFSTRKVILTAMILCIVSTFGFALTHNVWLAASFHFISGIGNGFCFLSCIMLASRWFPPKKQAFVIGIIVTVAMLGGVMAQTPLALLAENFGWRHAVEFDAMLGIGIMFLIWMFVSDFPAKGREAHRQERAALETMGFVSSLRQAIANGQNWLCGLYTGLLNLPIMLFGALWGSLYLTEVHHLSNTNATIVTSMIFIGTIVGSPLSGWFSDNLGLRRLPMLLGGIISLVIILMIIMMPTLSMRASIALFFALGFFTSTQIIAYPTITESNPRAITGTSIALASTLIMGGAGLAQPFFAYVMNSGWNGRSINNVPIYSISDFNHALYIIPIGFIIGITAAWFIKETNCQQQS